ncbi:outer membrane protein [Rhizobium sp. AAP43]|uniref:outer membrane protein n=1 Tax=Rhizobium sp. AAP43 TaxID=1523420 RepID=UPI0006B9C9FB|nr:outer membrane protein [Rhizobium sp. AAP43]KPF46600.1 hypothetical protein IP76_06120 [Rhizobium sp. AAP43]
MKTLLTAVAALLFAGTAMAADAVTADPAPPVAADTAAAGFDWTGGYVGVQAGHSWLDGHFETTGLDPLDANFDGPALGLFVGYNKQFSNNVVLGLDGDLDYNWNDEQLTSAMGAVEGKTDWQGSVRGRLGYAADRALIYVAAGYAAAHAEASIAGVGSATETFHGYTVGAGVDYAVTDRIFGRLDYRYNDFGSKDLNFGGAVADADLTQHAIKVGLGVKF